MSRKERKYCSISTSYLAGLFGDFLPTRTLWDVYHKEFESHKRSILDISENVWTVVSINGGKKVINSEGDLTPSFKNDIASVFSKKIICTSWNPFFSVL